MRENYMEDERIVQLYWQRSESAISETAAKYGEYCRRIAYNILCDSEDTEESLNDTYLGAWNSMPPHRPSLLMTFLGKLTRRIAIDKWRHRHADKRGGGEMTAVLDELADCAAEQSDVEATLEQHEMARVIGEFLDSLPVTERRVFLRRYWYMSKIGEIAHDFAFTEARTTSMLCRTRKRLRERLESEGYL